MIRIILSSRINNVFFSKGEPTLRRKMPPPSPGVKVSHASLKHDLDRAANISVYCPLRVNFWIDLNFDLEDGCNL